MTMTKTKKILSLLSSILALSFPTTSAAAGGLIVPLYVWPTISNDGQEECIDEHYIAVATSSAASRTIAILNPHHGPDWGTDSWMKHSYDKCITYLRKNGVKVIGYVYTKAGDPIHGYRDIRDVKNDINTWKRDYDVDGILVDEMTNRWPDDWDSRQRAEQFYQNVGYHVLNLFDLLVFNPGHAYFETIIEPWYGDRRVIVALFEDTQWYWQPRDCADTLWTTEQGTFPKGPWCQYVPEWDDIEPLKRMIDQGTILPEQNAAFIYDAARNARDTIASIDYGVGANIRWFYVTDKENTWSETPSDIVMRTQATEVMKL